MIAALYVSPHGPYVSMPDIDPWTLDRDATIYPGPYPVVAHPPCGHWGKYAHIAHDDGHTGPIAVEQVRRFGGVLEHPRSSKLWDFCTLPYPDGFHDHWRGWSIEVNQLDWGHSALKPTWLYIVGCPKNQLPAMPCRRQHTPLERFTRKGKRKSALELLSKTKRSLTPPAFAEWLVEIARRSRIS
jgi:hypothetical protein